MCAQPGLRRILYEKKAMVVGPAAPAHDILGKAEIVDEVERTHTRADQVVQLCNVGLEKLGQAVEPRFQPGADESLDLGAVVKVRNENLIAVAEAMGSNRLPQSVSRPTVQTAAWITQRKRQLPPRPPREDRRGYRRPDADPRARHAATHPARVVATARGSLRASTTSVEASSKRGDGDQPICEAFAHVERIRHNELQPPARGDTPDELSLGRGELALPRGRIR